MNDTLNHQDSFTAQIVRQTGIVAPALAPVDILNPRGVFEIEILDAGGNVRFKDRYPNTVVTTGKNILLNTLFLGSSYSVTGPYMGLISSVSFTAIVAGDSASSHTGWTEAGNAQAPSYTSPRPTLAFASASGGSITLSAPASYAITGSGTLEGSFIVLGSGAVSTIDNTAGTLFAAGAFTSGAAAVVSTETVNVTYTLSS